MFSSLEEVEPEIFPKISHVRASPTETDRRSAINFWNLPHETEGSNLFSNLEQFVPPTFAPLKLGEFTDRRTFRPPETTRPSRFRDRKTVLKEIKLLNPNYPAYKVFKILYRKHLRTKEAVEVVAEGDEANRAKGRRKGRRKRKETRSSSVEIVENKVAVEGGSELWTEVYKPVNSEEIFGNRYVYFFFVF